MASCAAAHEALDPLVSKGIQIGTLPAGTCVEGKVAYRVIRGSYDQLPKAWSDFPQKALAAARSAPRGPPGDVYVCTPMDHPDDPGKILTVLYVPVR